jgi:O-antigen/teichoic acid export membrane protein
VLNWASLGALVARPVVANSIATLFVRGSVIGLRLMLIVVVANLASPAEFGFIAMCLSLSEIGKVVADFGVDALSVRDYAIADTALDRAAIASRAAIIKLALGVLTIAVLCGILVLFYPLEYFGIGLTLVAINVISLWSGWSISYFQARMEIRRLTVHALVTMLVFGLGLVIVAAFAVPYWVAIALMPFHELLNGFLFSRLMQASLPTPWLTLKLGGVWSTLVRSLPIAVTMILATLYGRLDVLLLGALTDQTQIGYFGLAARLTEPLTFIAGAFAVSSYGRLSKLLSTLDQSHHWTQIWRALVAFGGLSVFSAVTTAICTAAALYAFLDEYLPAFPTVMLFSVSLMFRIFNFGQGSVLNALGKYQYSAITTAINLVLVMFLAWILVPVYRAAGAAMALVACEFLNSLLLFVMLRRTTRVAQAVRL